MISGLLKLIRFIIRSIRSQRRFPAVEIGFGTSIDENCKFEGSNRIGEFSSLSRSILGRYTYVGCRVHIDASVIGSFCSIASDVKIGLHEHPTREYVSTYPAFHTKWDLTAWGEPKHMWKTQNNTVIGNDVWIGENVIIKSGIIVGDGVVIGAGSVVVKDVPAYAIVAGIPARVIRFRMTEQQIVALESIGWWNWNSKDIAQRIDMFSDINGFIEKWK